MIKINIKLGKIWEKEFSLPDAVLKKHLLALGGSGSGKTVLCKGLIEEAAINNIPSILIDPQGDLASLAIIGEEKEEFNKTSFSKFKKRKVVIFTPASSKGVPLCLSPLKLPPGNIEFEDLVGITHALAESITKLIGFSLRTDKGKAAAALLYEIFLDSWKKKKEIGSFSKLASKVRNPGPLKRKVKDFISNEKDYELIAKKIKFLTIGAKDLLFQFGMPIDINLMLKKGQVNIIYLNCLDSVDDKHFFLFSIANELYNWMLKNPSKDLQALFMVDEIAEFIPAGARKPVTKEILKLIFKQARKYGIGCVVSTQNPGDIDYKAFAQFGTWLIGRITTKQDKKKIEDALKSLDGGEVIKSLPKLKPGEFIVFAPDVFDDIPLINTRWLYTEHKTLSESAVKKVVDDLGLREEFSRYYVKRKEKEIEVEEVELEVERKKGKYKRHFGLNYSEEYVRDFADGKKSKKFVFFGSDNEKVSSLKLLYYPFYLFDVRVKKKGLFGMKVKEYNLLIDGMKGNVLKVRGDTIDILGKYSELENLKKLHCNVPELDDGEIKGMKPKLSNMKKSVEKKFNAEVANSEIVYYPLYEVKLKSKKETRVVFVSGVNGKEIEV